MGADGFVAVPSALNHLGGTHERARLFCSVLGILADDLYQIGREAMALSLLEYADTELAGLLRWEREELLRAFSRACAVDSVARLQYDAFLQRHRAVADALPAITDGLERIAIGRLPERPLEYVIAALRFTEAVKLHLDGQRHDVLAHLVERLAPSELSRLDASLAFRDARTESASSAVPRADSVHTEPYPEFVK